MNVGITIDLNGDETIFLSMDEARELYKKLRTLFDPPLVNEFPNMVKTPFPEQNKLWPGNPGDEWKATEV